VRERAPRPAPGARANAAGAPPRAPPRAARPRALTPAPSPAAVPACVAFGAYTLANEHPHSGDKVAREYTHVRSKPFPWGEDALFTLKGHGSGEGGGH